MDGNTADPVVIALLFGLRCLVPLLIMLGLSYLLKRFGLIQEPPSNHNGKNGNNSEEDSSEGDLVHG